MTKLVLLVLICATTLVTQTKVDWVSQISRGPVYDVRTYGAKGDGKANDTAAIEATMAAVKTAGGGHVFFPKGVFRYVQTVTNYFHYSKYFTNEGSNVIISGVGDGTVLQFESQIGLGLTFGYIRTAWNTQCTRMDTYNQAVPNADCTRSEFPAAAGGWPVMHQFKPAPVGSKTIELVTHASASAFTAGMEVRLQSGVNSVAGTGNPPQHYEYNQVLSSNASTGIITFASPLDDYYDLQDSLWPPMIAIMTVVPKNILVRDLKITRTTCRPDPLACADFDGLIVHPGSVRNITFDRVTFTGAGVNSTWWNTYVEGFTIKNSVFENLTSDLGDAGYNFTLDHNVWKNTPQRALQVGSALRNYRITNNHFTAMGSIACCDNVITLSSTLNANHPSRKAVITGNTIELAAKQLGYGIGLFGMTDVIISDNIITAPGIPAGNAENGGLHISGSSNVRITNNLIRLSGTQTAGAVITDGNGPVNNLVLEGNNFGAERWGIRLEGAGTHVTVGCNQIYGAATPISDASSGTANTCSGAYGTTWYSNSGSATTTTTPLANHQFCGSFIVPSDLSIGHIVVPFNTLDATVTTDVGIYGAGGNIIAHTGPLLMNSPFPPSAQPWPTYPLGALNPTTPAAPIVAATFRIPAGAAYYCFLSVSSTLKLDSYANAAGPRSWLDMGLNSAAGACLPGADGSCPAHVLRPQIFTGSPYYSIGSFPIVILTP